MAILSRPFFGFINIKLGGIYRYQVFLGMIPKLGHGFLVKVTDFSYKCQSFAYKDWLISLVYGDSYRAKVLFSSIPAPVPDLWGQGQGLHIMYD